MRTRRTVGPNTTMTQQWNCYPAGQPRTYYGPETVNLTQVFKQISDDPKRRWTRLMDGSSVLSFKPCRSESWIVVPRSSKATVLVADANPDVYCDMFLMREFLHGQFLPPYTEDLGHWFAGRMASYCLGPFHDFQTRWDQCKPTMETRTNLSVFLAELTDIRRMFDLLPRAKDVWRNKTELAKYVNGLHLNYNFGWKPFISDLMNALDALSTLNERLEDFVQKAGKDISAQKGSKDIEHTHETSWVLPFNSDWKLSEIVSGTERLRSTFRFSYDLPRIPGNSMYWRAVLDSLGFKLAPSVIWQKLPFSFIVDWMVNLTAYLQAHEDSWIQPEIFLQETCSTSRYTVSAEWYLERTTLAHEKFFLATGEMQLFQRINRMPTHISGLSYGDLDADKIRLLVSLGLSFL